MLTYANHPEFELIELQHQAMDLWIPGLRSCLGTRFVIVSTDAKADEQCKRAGFLNCALVEVQRLDNMSIQFTCGFYAFSFFKYELLKESLQLVNEMFFFDADVLIFRNPWFDDNGLFRLDSSGVRVDPTFDFMFQREGGFSFDCSAEDINGGQYYIRNSTQIQSFIDNMFKYKEQIMSFSEGKFDQDYIKRAVEASHIKVCGLNHYRFTSGRHVYLHKTTDHILASEIVSFHFNGLTGRARTYRMNLFLQAIRNNRGIKLGEIFRVRDYFSDVVNDGNYRLKNIRYN